MKHIVLEEPGRFAFGDGPEPKPGEGEALVKVHRVGVCGTDIHAFHGRQPFFEYPRILGHELGVEIIEAPPGSPLPVGARCSLEPYMNHPQSQASRRGKTNCCDELQVLGVHTDGGLRPYLAVPIHKLHASDQLNDDQLALVETLCIGAHAATRGGIGPDDQVLVIGAGPIGLSVLEFARHLTGRPVTVADVSDARLDFVRQHLGIKQAINVSQTADPKEAIQEELSGDLPTVIFDATGNSASMHGTFELAAQGATIVFVGLFQGDVTFQDPLFHRKELTLKSSRNATAADFQRVIEAVESGKVDTAPWLTHRMPFSEMPSQFAEVTLQPDLLKAIVEMES